MPAYKYSKSSKKQTEAPEKKNGASSKKPAAKKQEAKPQKKRDRNPNSIINQILPYVWGLLAFAVAFCLIFTAHSGFIGKSIIKPLFCGLFGAGAFIIPILICIQAFLWKKNIETDTVLLKLISSACVLVSLTIVIHVISTAKPDISANLKTLWSNGQSMKGGGVIGGLIAALFIAGIDKPLTLCIFIPIALVFTTFVFGFTPASAFVLIKDKIKESR